MCAAFRLINGKKYKRKGKEVKKNPLDQRRSQSLEQLTDPLPEKQSCWVWEFYGARIHGLYFGACLQYV